MNIDEVILFIISELGGKVSSKTKLQKLCYFYSILSEKDLGFRPHFYGPYSPLVEKTLDELQGIGLIDKQTHHLGENNYGFEVIRYDYSINEYGKQVIEDITPEPELMAFLQKIKEVGDPDYLDLSIAAKAYFVLKREGKPLTVEEIKNKAARFNWKISSDNINKAIKILEEFGLVKTVSN